MLEIVEFNIVKFVNKPCTFIKTKMRKINLVTGLLLVFSHFVHGQCPTAGFSMPDSACAGNSFQLTNTSTGGQSYYWDLCPGDLETSPISFTDLPASPNLANAQQMVSVTDNGNYYLFIANYSGNNLLRYDFGTSTDNNPTVHDYGSFGGSLNGPHAVDVINDSGTWYALVANFNTNTITRVDLGSVITNNIASGTNLGLFGLNGPVSVKMAKDVSDYYAFVSNFNGNDFIKISFGNSIANTPSGFSVLNNAAFATNWGIDIIHDCNLNKWLVYVASYVPVGKVNVIDFGNTLANLGSLASPISCINNPSAIDIIRDGADWHLLIASNTSLQLQNIKLTGSELNITSTQQTYNNLALTSPRGISVFRDTNSFKVFICSHSVNVIKKIVFEKPCIASPITSTDSTS